MDVWRRSGRVGSSMGNVADRPFNWVSTVLLGGLLSCAPGVPTPVPVVGTVVDPSRIEGQVQGATFPQARALLSGSGHLFTATAGTLHAPATLTVPLDAAPGAPTASPLLPLDEAGCAFSSPLPAATLSVGDHVTILSTGNDQLGQVTEHLSAGQHGAGQPVLRIYSDRAAQVSGMLTCPEQLPVTYALSLRQGWNAATVSATANGTTVTDVPQGARSQLTGTTATPAVTLRLPETGLRFETTAPVEVTVTIQQIGGYSGAVTLSTDVPGLTVQPSSVVLPPLVLHALATGSAGALRPLQITTKLRFSYAPGANIRRPFTIIATGSSGDEVGRVTSMLEVARSGFALSTRDTDLALDPVAERSVPVCVSSEEQYHGPVTLGASDLPPGVSMVPVTVGLEDFACGLVALRGAGITRGSTSRIYLTAEGGGYHAQLAATLTVLGPAVSVSLAEPTVTVYQGSATTVPVQVTGEYGFSGPVQVGLRTTSTGVASGVVTVTIEDGETTTATVPVTVSSTAALGLHSIVPDSPEQLTTPEDNGTLRVRPPRFPIMTGRLLAPAGTGVWQRTDAGGPDARTSTLTRAGGSTSVSAQVPGNVERLIATPDGLLALTKVGGSALVSDEGSVEILSAPPIGAGHDLADSTDVAGLIWFTRQSAGQPTQLCTWNPRTGEVQIMDSTSIDSTYGSTITLSPDRRTVLILPRHTGVALTVQVATGAITRHILVGGYTSAAVSDQGDVWYAGYNTLNRSSARGAAEYVNVSTGQLIGFDVRRPDTLWGYDAGSVYRIETSTGSSTRIQLSDASPLRAVRHSTGGLSVVIAEGTQAFLSKLQ